MQQRARKELRLKQVEVERIEGSAEFDLASLRTRPEKCPVVITGLCREWAINGLLQVNFAHTCMR
jgi:hypothetical protein